MEIIGYHNGVEVAARIGPSAAFEIGAVWGDTRHVRQCREGRGIAIHRLDSMAARGEEARMPPATAGEIKHGATLANSPGPALHPRGDRWYMRMSR